MARRTRMLAAGMGLLLGAILPSACFRSNTDPHSIDVLVGENPQYASAQKAWFARIQREFKAQTGASVHFETYTDLSEEQTKLETSAVTSTGPDVYLLGTTFTPVAFSTKSFMQLSEADWKKIGGRQRFFQPQLAMSGPDRAHQIGVPMSMRPFGMVYNTELFKKAGIAGPPKTWNEFVADAKKLTDPSKKVYGAAIDYADDADPWKYIWTQVRQSGGDLVSRDQRKSLLASPQVKKAFSFYFGLLTKDKVTDPKSIGWKATDALAAFASGKAAMLPMVTPSSAPTLLKSPVKGKYALATMPLVPYGHSSRPAGGVGAGSIVSGDNMAVADYSEHKALALKYIALVTSKREQAHYSKVFGDLPSNQQAAVEVAAKNSQTQQWIKAERVALPTAYTGAWSNVQLALGNVVAQSLDPLSHGSFSDSDVTKLLNAGNATVQSSLNRANRDR